MNKHTYTKALALLASAATLVSLGACGVKKDAAPAASADTVTIGTTGHYRPYYQP